MRTVHGSPYTFSVKPKWRTVVFWFFAARSSAEAYFRSSPPRGHSTVGFPMRCEGFVAIWLGARENIAHNRFQLLFINIDNRQKCNNSNNNSNSNNNNNRVRSHWSFFYLLRILAAAPCCLSVERPCILKRPKSDGLFSLELWNFSGTSALNRAVAAVSCCAEKRDLLLEL